MNTRLEILQGIERESEASLNIDISKDDDRFNDKWCPKEEVEKTFDYIFSQIPTNIRSYEDGCRYLLELVSAIRAAKKDLLGEEPELNPEFVKKMENAEKSKSIKFQDGEFVKRYKLDKETETSERYKYMTTDEIIIDSMNEIIGDKE